MDEPGQGVLRQGIGLWCEDLRFGEGDFVLPPPPGKDVGKATSNRAMFPRQSDGDRNCPRPSTEERLEDTWLDPRDENADTKEA